MRYTSTIALITFLALSTQTVNAAASKEENVGIGTGAVIGVLAGGPVGFIIGAVLGAKIGDTLHNKSEEIEAFEKSLQNSRRSALTLERDMTKLNSEIKYLQSVARPELVSLMQAGIADERGDSKYNLELSEKRVEFVRNMFISAGVHPTRISSSAHGESVAQNPDVDSYALERRVSVKLFIDNVQSLAANSR